MSFILMLLQILGKYAACLRVTAALTYHPTGLLAPPSKKANMLTWYLHRLTLLLN